MRGVWSLHELPAAGGAAATTCDAEHAPPRAGMRPGIYTYVKPAAKPKDPGANGINAALKYASQMLRGEAARVDASK